MDEWARVHGQTPVNATQILELVQRLGVFGRVLMSPNEAGMKVALARRVLTPLTDRPVRGWIVRRSSSGSSSLYRLVPAVPTASAAGPEDDCIEAEEREAVRAEGSGELGEGM